jgi:hypothetical protein
VTKAMATDRKPRSLLLRAVLKTKTFLSRNNSRRDRSSFNGRDTADPTPISETKQPQIQSSSSTKTQEFNKSDNVNGKAAVTAASSDDPKPQSWLVPMDQNTYQYTKLPSPTVIRILELLPGKTNDPIKFSLRIADWVEDPSFEAISYAWGDPTDVLECFAENKSFWITKSLYQALQNFRYEEETRNIWADAVW